MAEAKIEPHRITKPIQILAVWFAALVLVVGSFLGSAALIEEPKWICASLVVSAIIFVPLFLMAAFLMQTRFRTHLQDDKYYSDWLNRQEQAFKQFKPENEPPRKISDSLPKIEKTTLLSLEQKRIEKYANQKGLFLIHAWRPSGAPFQEADIVIWLHQHGEGPLLKNEVDFVEYQFGPKFFDGPVIKKNAHEKFKIGISAYGPLLCIANVHIKGLKEAIELERYIDFEEIP